MYRICPDPQKPVGYISLVAYIPTILSASNFKLQGNQLMTGVWVSFPRQNHHFSERISRVGSSFFFRAFCGSPLHVSIVLLYPQETSRFPHAKQWISKCHGCLGRGPANMINTRRHIGFPAFATGNPP